MKNLIYNQLNKEMSNIKGTLMYFLKDKNKMNKALTITCKMNKETINKFKRIIMTNNHPLNRKNLFQTKNFRKSENKSTKDLKTGNKHCKN